MTWTLPNILTIARLLTAPLIAIVFVVFMRPLADMIAVTLFVLGAFTDFLDGRIARSWGQESKFGAMLDPIADKLSVFIALFTIVMITGPNALIVVPSVLIVFREIFVTGLREFLGENARLLKVTKLAKWKTATQMVAIAVLFARGVFQYMMMNAQIGMDAEVVASILDGSVSDEVGLVWMTLAYQFCWFGGIALLWVAAGLTVITGWDYFSKARPYLEETSD